MVDSDYHHQVFEQKLREALAAVQRILDANSSQTLCLAQDVDQTYTDKYRLADFLTNTAIAALVIALEQLGLTKEILESLDASKEITMRFCLFESCEFEKEIVEKESLLISKETEEVTTTTEDFGTTESSVRKSTIKQILCRSIKQNYIVRTELELSIYSGTNVRGRKVLKNRKCSSFEFPRVDAIRSSSPFQERKEVPPAPAELSLTWLFRQIDKENLGSHFAIDRDGEETKTPTRNLEIEEAMEFFGSVKEWAERINNVLASTYKKYKVVDLDRLEANDIFVPILPFLVDQHPNEDQDKIEAELDSNFMLLSLPSSVASLTENHQKTSIASTTKFLTEQSRTLVGKERKLRKDFPDPKTENELISSDEAIMFVLCIHIAELASRYSDSVRYMESILEQHVLAAIGKKLNGVDLERFMRYHNQKLLSPCPEPFCYAIRRPSHDTVGVFNIEHVHRNQTVESIWTHVRQVPSNNSIELPLNASTTLALTGKTYLHGWLNQRFGQTPPGVIRLSARARQFSSFVLVVGTMTDQNRMQPKDAIILRNKDEVHIPLLLDEIPTVTEFKNSINPLSPEQQKFAESFRSMQLDSSVLGVCVVQIKPQLEKLLGLPEKSLTKEIRLTEELTELFVEYQIPSDLVSCDIAVGSSGDENKNGESKYDSFRSHVSKVREHAKSISDVITAQKKGQIEDQKNRTEMTWEDEEDILEMYVRSDGKKFRRVKKAVISNSITNQIIGGEVYVRPDGKKVRRIRKRAEKPRFCLSGISSESPTSEHVSKNEALMLMKEKQATKTAPRLIANDHKHMLEHLQEKRAAPRLIAKDDNNNSIENGRSEC